MGTWLTSHFSWSSTILLVKACLKVTTLTRPAKCWSLHSLGPLDVDEGGLNSKIFVDVSWLGPSKIATSSTKVSQPHFEASVKMRLALPKVGTWSPQRLPKLQSSIAGVKIPCLEVFFIPLERFWSVDVENGLAWAIRTFVAQVKVERAGSQTGNLTPNH